MLSEKSEVDEFYVPTGRESIRNNNAGHGMMLNF